MWLRFIGLALILERRSVTCRGLGRFRIGGRDRVRIVFAYDGGEDDALDRVGPASIALDATAEGAGGGDDSGGSGRGVRGVVEDALEDEAEIAAANGVESESVSVAVNRKPGDRFVLIEEFTDGLRAVPMDEKFLDGLALGMMADGAFAAVAPDIGSPAEEAARGSVRGAKIVPGLADRGDRRLLRFGSLAAVGRGSGARGRVGIEAGMESGDFVGEFDCIGLFAAASRLGRRAGRGVRIGVGGCHDLSPLFLDFLARLASEAVASSRPDQCRKPKNLKQVY